MDFISQNLDFSNAQLHSGCQPLRSPTCSPKTHHRHSQREICGDSPQLVFLLPMRALASEAVWLVNAFIHGGISDSSRNIWPIADEKVPTWLARLPRWCSRWLMVVSSTLAASYR
jgi:hypothetical protein